ncbi:MAG TPA: GGDEF domain-containing protein [Plasticicumulans sp.]|uniref:sensor domain-containing diguanylate cyclase n=1 Tax=Plasticicumulans sp. TaxID=2307179 RepID=UPI002C33AB91|nr:GGDEF domain-containing protein [Plasticicumulans sp.]HMW42747.1 GGDEF domain-containing protein [Plasticicumulans sp.]HMZ09765.1 GGDEF domain-containing protein [Plasticicumulans sp.]HNB88951.1 GGDEF domain-containing protein [Plasticicumulans sp.]HNG50283.1 GGDEF domain-containing protein [Plasticicumulans sp.]HNI22341.1 GGDEF domain-containing protein [Plasticicumulans sp.]
MDETLLARLGACTHLPTLPAVAMRIIELGDDPDAGIGEIADVVCRDPALTAKLLKIANSPLYAQRRKVENLRQAMMLLGLNAAMTLALSFSLVGGFGASAGGLDHLRYWRRSLLTALASRTIGLQAGLGQHREELFLAGLLQDIGILVLDAAAPQDYARGLDACPGHLALAQAEQAVFGADHAEVGSWMLDRWGMPEYLVLATRFSHALTAGALVDSGENARFFACTTLAGWLAEVWLNPPDEAGTARIGMLAQDLLGLDAAAVTALVDEIGAQIPETSALFEIELPDAAQVTAVLDHAREVLMVRNLQIVQEAAQARRQAEHMQERARLLEERSRRDPLTGAYNRSSLQETLASEFRLATEGNWPLTLAFIDLDHFKRVNDTFGHQAGDEVLCEIVRRLNAHIRCTDIVARFGGEEFVLVLPGLRRNAALTMLERVRAAIAAEPCRLAEDQQVTVTLSIGIATHGEDKPYESAESLLRNADRAVYDAKRNGRNRVECYRDD